MNVWVKVTRKRVKCRHCEQFIEAGEFQVICTYFMKLKHSERTWTKAMHFHAKDPYCWIDRAITEVGLRPFTETRGRKPDAMSDEVKEARQKILRRRASVMQRINTEMETQRRPSKLIHLTDLLEKLVVEIEPYGGVPKSWK